MRIADLHVVVALIGAAALFFVTSAGFAQTTDQKPPEKPQTADGKDAQKRTDEFAEAEKILGGLPVARNACGLDDA